MKMTDDQAIRAGVREHYASVVTNAAKEDSEADNCCAPSCCGGASHTSEKVGYSADRHFD